MIEYFVDVAKECINIGNFNSLMAIIGKLPIGISNITVMQSTTVFILETVLHGMWDIVLIL